MLSVNSDMGFLCVFLVCFLCVFCCPFPVRFSLCLLRVDVFPCVGEYEYILVDMVAEATHLSLT